jgi:DNA polymerase
MSNVHSSFLKEMGITEWTSRESCSQSVEAPQEAILSQVSTQASQAANVTSQMAPRAHWWFFGSKPQGDAQTLFQNLIRVLGLAGNEWSWKSPSDNLSHIQLPENGMPVVAFAFGGPAAQIITGERDSLPQLRETILALNTGNDEEIPVIASLDLAQAASKTRDKALLWQDLLLAKSVLQSI